MKKKKVQICIRIDEELKKKIVNDAKRNSTNLTDHIMKKLQKKEETKHYLMDDINKKIYEEEILPLFQEVKELHNKYIASGKQDVELLKKLYTEMGKACTKTSDILISMMDTEQQILYQSFNASLNSEEYHKYLKAIDKK